MLFVEVPKVKVEISHRGLAGIAHCFNILDDRGAENRHAIQLSLTKKIQKQMLYEPKYALAGASYKSNKDRY